MTTPIFLDCEASSLASTSYPIEVAFNHPDGSVENHLISPAGIARWTDWSARAEQLHGLSRERLLREGRPPADVCRRLNECLAGQTVYTDNADYDRAWLDELFAASRSGMPAFRVASVQALFKSFLPDDRDGNGAARLAEIERTVRQQLPGRHRAGWDVEFLLRVYAAVSGRSEADTGAAA